MQKILVLALLILETAEDCRKKELTVAHMLAFGAMGLALELCYPTRSIWNILGGALLGGALMLVSQVSRGSVGMGDGVLLVITGIYLGGYENLKLLCTGLFFSACWSLILLIWKKTGKEERIAFVPFLLAAYIVIIIE